MKTTVNFSQFCDSFSDQYTNNFTYAGKRALFDYLEQYEEETGEELELDPVALCCEYTQYDDLEEFNAQYNGLKGDDNNEANENWYSMKDLQERTTVIEIEGSESFIIADF